MSIHPNCPNRIKPKLLREQKTEALLVFIRTTLEQTFKQIESNGIEIQIGTQEDTEHIYKCLKDLYENLSETVVNSSYLQNLIASSGKTPFLSMLAQKEKPLMVYYDSLVKGIEVNLPSGTSWIPELMVISLLSQWILEEEKSVYLYPFLNEIDYIDLISRYDASKKTLEEDRKDVIMNMYTLSTILIEKLKNTTYKTTSHKKKKKR